jgi:hypothetical protein
MAFLSPLQRFSPNLPGKIPKPNSTFPQRLLPRKDFLMNKEG